MNRGGILRIETGGPRPPSTQRVRWADTSPAADAAARPWGDLPDNAVVRIFAFLHCRADRVHVASVNRYWSAAVMGPRPPARPPVPPLPPQLPWLIYPSTETPVFYSPLGHRFHWLRHLPADVRRARFCGSADGGWLVLSLDSRHAHALYNLYSGLRIPLPPRLTAPSDDDLPLVLRAATLSAPPSPDNRYMVAAIVLVAARTTAAFWSEGSDTWFTAGQYLEVRPQDVLFYGGAFYFVNDREGVVSFRPVYAPNSNVYIQRVDYQMQQREGYDDDIVFVGGAGEMRRYLVESRGRLLMVVRYVYDEEEGTQMFRVFEFSVMEPVIDALAPRATWQVLDDDLDGRMLFLGPGCSRSFEVDQYHGFQHQESVMFYLDERFATVHLNNGRTQPESGAVRSEPFADPATRCIEQVDQVRPAPNICTEPSNPGSTLTLQFASASKRTNLDYPCD